MADTKPLASPPSTTLYVIGQLRWHREWYETLETRQVWLLDRMARLLDQMGNNGGTTLRFVLLGTGTVIVEDLIAVRPDLLALVTIYNAGGRLGISPWYILPDQHLASGESLVRNLLTARVDAARHGIKLMPIAYMPDATFQSRQTPQILRNFAISTTFLNTGDPFATNPYYWEAPDGTSILVIPHNVPATWHNDTPYVNDLADSLNAQKIARPDGPLLWLADYDDMQDTAIETLDILEKRSGVPTSQIDLPDYLRIVRRNLTQHLSEVRQGALDPYPDLPPGTLSTRLYLKQAHAHLQSKLTYALEPWLALALSHGELPHPENSEALLHYAWRGLLKTQSNHVIGGTSIDAVHTANEVTYRQIDDSTDRIIENTLDSLEGTITRAHVPSKNPNPDSTAYVVVWNPHNWPLKQVVEVELVLPAGRNPARLRVPGSEQEQRFGWEPTPTGGVITFLADAPPVGYAVYTLDLSDEPVAKYHLLRQGTERSISNVNGDTLTIKEGVLNWQRADGTITDLLRFIDEGDAGDAYHYAAPQEDMVVKAEMVRKVRSVSSPVYERLIIDHRMRVAPELNDDLTRGRGVRLIEVQTEVTFYDHVPGVYFRTTFENTAHDHRLRAHLRTGIDAKNMLTQSIFNFDMQPVGRVHATQGVCAVHDGVSSLALVTRGLPEVESTREDGQVTLGLTLVRAIGVLCRESLDQRTYSLAPSLPIPDAQCQRMITAEYGLIATTAGDRAALLRESQNFNAPLQAYQYDVRPGRPRRSYLSVISDQATAADTIDSDGAGAILTAFKSPIKGKGWVLRLYNPHDHMVEVMVTPHARPEHVYLCTMSEDSIKFLETDLNGRIQLSIDSGQIITLRLLFHRS